MCHAHDITSDAEITKMSTKDLHSGIKQNRFANTSNEEKQKLLDERGSKNTNKAVKCAVGCLEAYLSEKSMGTIADIDLDKWPEVLENFYTNACTKKGERYHVQTLKSMRSCLNRFFTEKMKINIIEDKSFNSANLMFKSVQVHSKKQGKAVTKKTEKISDYDMKLISNYFNVDHVKSPNPKILRQCVMFNIIYYLCQRGQENLYDMTDDFFEIEVEPTGERYVHQVRDELDKNHHESTTQIPNQGWMYEVEGEKFNSLVILALYFFFQNAFF